MKADQLELIVTLSQPTLSPDGTRAVVAARHPSYASDSYAGQLWEVDTADSAEPRRITAGALDTAPQFSPDGRMIAFLRRDAKGRNQLALLDARGGEARTLTSLPLGVTDFQWDRAARRIAIVAPLPEEGRYGTIEGVGPALEDPRRVTGNKYKMNGRGYVQDQPLGILLLDVPPLDEEPWIAPVGRAAAAEAKEPKKDTPGTFGGTHGEPRAVLVTPAGKDATQPEFSPDGDWLYFTAALHEGADSDLVSEIYRVKLGDEPAPTAPQRVAGAPRAHSHARFSADGATLYMLGQDLGETGIDFVARQAGIFALDTSAIGGDAEPRALTNRDEFDYSPTVRLVPYKQGGVAALARVRGSVELHYVRAKSNGTDAKVRALVQGRRVIQGAAAADGTLVVSFADPVSPGELGLVEKVNGAGVIRALTTFAATLNKEAATVVPREITVPAADGYPVHGWMFLPEGPGPHPVLLNIHGGPFAEYDWSWFDEAQVYVQAGYAVVQCNPRGSASYGREHGLAIKGRMGTHDFTDIIAFLEGALKLEASLDSERLGVLGGSYGGYMTAWIIAHDHRFKAAMVERGFLDPESFVGTSDIGWFFGEEYTGTDLEAVRAQSPIAKVDQVRTPTLVIHSEQDWRCPLEQAERYFALLRRTGSPAEMLIFPGENHELSRSGSPWHRKQRFDAILQWFDKYLAV